MLTFIFCNLLTEVILTLTKNYKNNIIRRESRTSIHEIMSAHQAIRAFQNKEDKENNLKYNAPKKAALKAKVYNFLERPSGWLCFIYHFTSCIN